MAYEPKDADFKAISKGAKESDAFRKMAGTSDAESPGEDAAEGGEEAEDLRAAFEATDAETFAANMLSAIKSCIANYGPVKK